jgi:hypothetical protein
VSILVDENKALNEAEEPKLDTTPVSEPEAPEEVVVEEVESAEETPEVATETEEAPKKSYSHRIGELVKERDQAKEEAKSLSDKLAELNGSVEPQQYVPQTYEPIVAPGEEIDATELDKRLQAREQRIIQNADALVQLRGKQQEAVSRIGNEAQDVVRKYSKLDPKSEDFDRELSDTITEATEAYVSKNPYTASVSKFVDRLMKPYQGSVDKEVGKATETIAKQVSEAALRPTSIRKPEKTANEKSIEELEQELGIIQA